MTRARVGIQTHDTVSDVVAARTGVGSISERTPAQVRAAQLVLVSAGMPDGVSLTDALCDDALRARIREVLSAAGIFNKNARVETSPAKTAIGLKGMKRRATPPAPGERESNGRLSRRGRPRSVKSD